MVLIYSTSVCAFEDILQDDVAVDFHGFWRYILNVCLIFSWLVNDLVLICIHVPFTPLLQINTMKTILYSFMKKLLVIA